MPFAQRENIHAFCEAAKTLGVKDISNFTADDLFEVRKYLFAFIFRMDAIGVAQAKNMKQVVICLHALGQQAHMIPDYDGIDFSSETFNIFCSRITKNFIL